MKDYLSPHIWSGTSVPLTFTNFPMPDPHNFWRKKQPLNSRSNKLRISSRPFSTAAYSTIQQNHSKSFDSDLVPFLLLYFCTNLIIHESLNIQYLKIYIPLRTLWLPHATCFPSPLSWTNLAILHSIVLQVTIWPLTPDWSRSDPFVPTLLSAI